MPNLEPIRRTRPRRTQRDRTRTAVAKRLTVTRNQQRAVKRARV